MAEYLIPEIFRPGFDEIFKLDEQKIERIVEIIKEIPIGTGPKTFIDQLSSKLPIDNIQQISRTIFSLGSFLISQQESIDSLVKDIANSYNQSIQSKISDENLQTLERKLKIIFSGSENLFLSFKTLNLLNENERIFLEARIVTDIRLVFNKDLSSHKRNAAIFHNLKLEFQKSSNREDFFIALDHYDLIKLKEIIDRAIDKEKIIKSDYNDLIEIIEISE